MTLVFNADDVREIFGANPEYTLSYARYRVESPGLVGMTFYCGYIYRERTLLGLALIDNRYAAPGTDVTVLWGEDAGGGGGSAQQATFTNCHRIRATVQPAPYNEFARTQYRQGTI